MVVYMLLVLIVKKIIYEKIKNRYCDTFLT
jgi:hypothetical protein